MHVNLKDLGSKFIGEADLVHGGHWQMARYELPVKEIARQVGKRQVVDIEVGDSENLAYVHKYTGKRVEFTRPRVDNMAAALEEADAKWQCELAIAEANKRQPADCRVGFIDLATVRTTKKIVDEWHAMARQPSFVKWPTKLGPVSTPGAFGGSR